MKETKTLNRGEWKAISLMSGTNLTIRALYPGQAVEFIALSSADPRERLSTTVTTLVEHVNTLRSGTRLLSQNCISLLTVVDLTNDVHDLMLEACNPALNRALYGAKDDTSCWKNFRDALQDIGLDEKWIPYPLGVFRQAGELNDRYQLLAASSRKGDYVRLLVEEDIIAIASACPVSAPSLAEAIETVELEWENAT